MRSMVMLKYPIHIVSYKVRKCTTASTLSSKIQSINKLLLRTKQTANKLQFVFLGLRIMRMFMPFDNVIGRLDFYNIHLNG